MLDERTGKPKWKVTIPKDVAAVIPFDALGAREKAWTPRPADKPGPVWLLSTADGSPQVTLELRTKTPAIQRSGQELVVQDGKRLRFHALDGKRLRSHDLPEDGGAIIGKTLVFSSGSNEALVFDRATLKERARWSGRHDLVALEGGLGAGRILVYRRGATKAKTRTAGRVRLYRID